MRIVITKRTADVMAHIEGELGYWDCGKNAPEAIGNLVLSHPERFHVEIRDTRLTSTDRWRPPTQE